MKKELIEQAAKAYAGTGQDADYRKLRDLGAFCWTTEEMIDFAISIHDQALEEAAKVCDFKREHTAEPKFSICASQVAVGIRALKVRQS